MPDNDFSTPNQLEYQRAIAKALLEESGKTPSGTSGHFTAVSPLAPFAQMAEALSGSLIGRRAAERERQSMIGANTPPEHIPGAPYTPGPGAEDDEGAEAAPKTADASAGGGDFLETVMKPMIAQRESADSKDPYRALGPPVRSGDRAYGKYQVMGNNIPEWTQAALGKPMSPQEFLANDKAQEAVASHRLGQYLAQTGNPRDAASMWFSGKPFSQAQNLRAHDPSGKPIGISGGQYAGSFPTTLPGAAPGAAQSPQGGSAMAFSGEPANAPIQMPGSPTAMSTALAGEGAAPAAGGAGAPTKVAGGPSAAPAIGPAPVRPVLPGAAPSGPSGEVPAGAIPQRQRVTREEYIRIMSNPYTSPEQRTYIQQSYFSQFQPQMVKDDLGREVVVSQDPRTGHQTQMLINTPFAVEQDVKGVKTKNYYQWQKGPDGTPYLQRSSKVPPAGAAAPAAPAAPATPDEDVPSLKFAPEGKEGKGAEGGGAEALPAEITKGPEAAKAERATMLGTKPPEAAAGALPFDKVAETKLPPAPSAPGGKALEDMDPAEQFNWVQNQENAQRATQHQNDANINETMKANKATQDVARVSLGAKTDIDVGSRLIQDPRLQALMGPGHDLKRDWSDVKAFLGNQDATLASGLDQTFQKIISSGIIKTLKSDYGGLGQIRNKEIELSDKATLSQRNTLESNLAILEIAKRTFERNAMIGKIANAYMEGNRWDKDGKPVPGKTGGIPSMAEMSRVINTYIDHHPIFDDTKKGKDGKTEMDHYISLFDKKEEEAEPVKSGGARTVDTLPEGFAKRPKAPPPGVEVPMR
jgi:hypothetical protein